MSRKQANTALRKTSIAVPADLLALVDREAKARHESRSRFVSRVLREAMRARSDREITRRLDALFADAEVAEEQRLDAEEWAKVFAGRSAIESVA